MQSSPPDPGARGAVVVTQSEDIDIANADALAASVIAAVPNSAAGAVLDCSGVRYVDSAGIRMLVTIAERLHHRRQRLRIVLAPESGIRRVLQIANLDTTLLVDDSVEAALGAFASMSAGC